MSYSVVSVTLTSGQIKKLQSNSAKECGVSITLKPTQMSGGSNKISLTKTQLKHFNDAMKNNKGTQIDFSKAAIANMVKNGGIFPFIIPALAALATGALSGAAGFGVKKVLDKVTGGTIKSRTNTKKKGRGLRLPGSRFTRTYPS